MVRDAAGAAIRLRPHHLLCILTFVGKGYSPAFVENYRLIIARIAAGAPIALVRGPDDICAGIDSATESGHCFNASVALRDDAARVALAGLPGLGALSDGTGTIDLRAGRISELRNRFAQGEIRTACAGCEWSPLCTSIAADGFTATVL